jgi:hypothetical protein
MQKNKYITKHERLLNAILDKNIKNIENLINNENVDPSEFDNNAIIKASYEGNIDVIKLLLSDLRVDPSDDLNSAISICLDYNHIEAIKLLWKDKRVKDTLKNNNSNLYKKIFNTVIKNKVCEF